MHKVIKGHVRFFGFVTLAQLPCWGREGLHHTLDLRGLTVQEVTRPFNVATKVVMPVM